ncbi:MAG: Xaa-Pro peptidase family protein [Halieaceae bacterium]|jgi:Xaa-Pro dipeptidase|nr:Xaa-Pro peptidase family protein [Halieaceae bacterium]
MVDLSRRRLLHGGAALAATAPLLVPTAAQAAAQGGAADAGHPELAKLVSITKDAALITDEQRAQRRAKLSGLLAGSGAFAALIEPSASLDYFTGVKWGLSERITAAVITADGDSAFITPAFEESRLREMAGPEAEIIIWQEDEDPFVLLAQWLREKSPKAGTVALDEAVRYFIAFRLGEAAKGWTLRSAASEVNACRMVKDDSELALMKLANAVTIAAYQAIHPLVEKGMSGPDITALMQEAQARLGGERPAGGTQVDKGSALPHGSREPEYVRDGSVVLMDFGCGVGGYRSDISRTFVFGKPDRQQQRIWDLVRRGQDLAFATAKPGVPAGEVDKRVRRMYAEEGFGPGYQLPGLSHRLGHGIGMQVHEPINFVGNETTPLQPGMCFSNEPGIYMPGSYGVRLEDCIYITENGAGWFSEPPSSLDKPMG